ncbi:MAG: phosphate-selective porin OprO/OprP [Pirellulaceae bacterium]|jgi:phosphate-selective porin OprO/OprP
MKITQVFRAIVIAGVVCLCRTAWAQDAPQIDGEPGYGQFISNHSVADSLGDLQKQIEKQNDAISDLKSAMKKKVDPGHSGATMKVFGRIHADFWGFPESDAITDGFEGGNPQDRLGFRRMRFGVSGKLPSNMLYKIEMEFAGGNKTEFRDAYLGWSDIPFFQKVLLGNQKRPYGLDHLNSSRFNVFLERPFVIESFNQDSRRFGLVSYGVSECQDWNWRYGVYNTELMQNDGQAINDHLQLEVAGRLANTFWYDEASGGRGYGHWAIAGSHAAVDGGSDETRFLHRPEARSSNKWLSTGTIADADNYNLLAFETAMNWGAVQFVAEYQNIWLERDTGDTVRYHGGYMQASYFLTGEHMPWDRASGTIGRIKPFEDFFLVNTCDDCVGYGMGAWQVAVRWSYADFSEVIAVPTAGGTAGVMGESLTVGLNWYWTANARMQFNWIHGAIENAAGNDGEYDIVGARFMVDF